MRYSSLIGSMMLMVLLVSCAPAMAPKTGFNSVAQQSRIVFLRAEKQTYTLGRYLKVVKELARRSDAGLLNAVVVFNNNSREHRNLACDVQFVFLDQDGIELEKSNWQPYMFTHGVDKTIKQVAMNPLARDFKVYVRAPRSSMY